jgi:acyl-coenzyme A thioesterase PaaI-like protein
MTTWATDRLDALIAGATPPPVVEKLELGTLDAWGEGWVTKLWTSKPDLLNSDGSMFGGYLAALADQMLAFAAMTVLPGDHMFRTANLAVSFFKVGRGVIWISRPKSYRKHGK